MEGRFLLAILLMIAVIVVTNLLFPPAPPEGAPGGADTMVVDTATTDTSVAGRGATPGIAGEDTSGVPAVPESVGEGEAGAAREGAPPEEQEAPRLPEAVKAAEEEEEEETPRIEGDSVVVASSIYRLVFDTRGAALESVELLRFESHAEEGPAQLIPEEARTVLGQRLLVGNDTVDLRDVTFTVEPPGPVELGGEGGGRELRFRWDHPSADFGLEMRYTFVPDSYVVHVEGAFRGVDRGVLLTDLGPGLAFNEADREDEAGSMGYVVNHTQEGIRSRSLSDVEEATTEDGPFFWGALKSKYFLLALLAGESPEADAHLGGLIVRPLDGEHRALVTATQPLRGGGAFRYRVFLGPQDFERLSTVGEGLESANPYGWKWLQPVIRPLVGIVTGLLLWMHETLSLAYGWVLILFGVLMRLALFPLNQKAMRAQLRNMAVQPLLKEIQEKHKDDPEKLQQEMMKLYKEHGFNPLAGCLPMLLPWPVLITLFFVFRNTIELRGVEFLWLPDLSAADPLYILPVILGISMFALQFVSYRSMEDGNPQMKMMMWLMPAFMVFIFLNLPSGLNLYYATANIATFPQQYWIAQERKKARKTMPSTGDDGS